MKRILCACLAALLLMAGWAALAEPDFSGLSLEELYAARLRLDAAIEALESAQGAGYYEDGSYLVGRDLPEGDYALQERENAVFASVVVRAGDSAGDALILHKLVSGQADLHLSKGTWVTLAEVLAWPLGAEPSLLGEDGSAGEGAYLVGEQLPPGDYVAVPEGKAPLSSYSVYSGILGAEAQLTKFEVLHGEVTLALEQGDYVELSGCRLNPAE